MCAICRLVWIREQAQSSGNYSASETDPALSATFKFSSYRSPFPFVARCGRPISRRRGWDSRGELRFWRLTNRWFADTQSLD